MSFWLLQGERDGNADQVEGFALGAGGLGEHGHGSLSASKPDLVISEFVDRKLHWHPPEDSAAIQSFAVPAPAATTPAH